MEMGWARKEIKIKARKSLFYLASGISGTNTLPPCKSSRGKGCQAGLLCWHASHFEVKFRIISLAVAPAARGHPNRKLVPYNPAN